MRNEKKQIETSAIHYFKDIKLGLEREAKVATGEMK
jgi:hypothetical protein